ncbi:MAG: 5-formyltetrahydrofolate cyclo-ligase [Bifidobacteriaceae bacterium]|nr:5-formyltetrahydrofolate cyclo-ligase [Bifidobacteriaceae bacterium]
MEAKSALRQIWLARRSQCFADEVTAWPWAQNGCTVEQATAGWADLLPPPGALVAAYWSFGHEPPTLALLAAWLEAGRRIIVPARSDQPAWAELSPTQLAGQPPSLSDRTLEPSVLAQAECVVVPALLADRSGTRLGRGGGWYDRALLSARPNIPRIALVNPAELLEAGQLPRQAHDQPISHVRLPNQMVNLDQ